MPCSAKEAAGELRRLKVLTGWREWDDETKSEMARHLSTTARTPYHAKAIIDEWLRNEKWLPAPSQLRELAERAPIAPPLANRGGCEECHHTGRVSGWYLWTVERFPSGDVRCRYAELIPSDGSICWLMYEPDIKVGKNQTVRLCNNYCGCSLGQRLRAGYLQYLHEQAK